MSKEIKEEKKPTGVIGYKGNLIVSLRKNGKTISKRKLKNSGTKNLFLFICNCLAGNYANAQSSRPKFIRLYKIGEKGAPIPNDIWSTWSKDGETTLNAILYKETPIASIVDTSMMESAATVKFSFMIPFTQLDTSRVTNFIVLYNNSLSTDFPLASFIVRDEDNPNLLGSLYDLSEISSSQNEFNLYIEWTMQIDNKGVI